MYSPDDYFTLQFISFTSLSTNILHYNTESTRLAVWSSWEPFHSFVWERMCGQNYGTQKEGNVASLSSLSFCTQRTLCLVQNFQLCQEKYIIALLLQLEILNTKQNQTWWRFEQHDWLYKGFNLFIFPQAENWTVCIRCVGQYYRQCAL